MQQYVMENSTSSSNIESTGVVKCSKYIKNPKSHVLGCPRSLTPNCSAQFSSCEEIMIHTHTMTHIVQVWVWYNCTTLRLATGNCFLNAGRKLQSLLFLIDSVRSHLWNSLELQQPPRFFFNGGVLLRVPSPVS